MSGRFTYCTISLSSEAPPYQIPFIFSNPRPHTKIPYKTQTQAEHHLKREQVNS